MLQYRTFDAKLVPANSAPPVIPAKAGIHPIVVPSRPAVGKRKNLEEGGYMHRPYSVLRTRFRHGKVKTSDSAGRDRSCRRAREV